MTAAHFEDIAKQAHAAKLGLWVFLASEVLLFGAIVALFLVGRAEHPDVFHEGVARNTKVLGSVNTAVLLTSSTVIACSAQALREGARRRSAALVASTIALGVVFLTIKFIEYAKHFREGIYPGKSSPFWTLYFGMTGLHAVHVTVGLGVLSFLLVGILRGRIDGARSHPLELGATYWHLVDVIWIFLWPLLYLA